MDKAFVRATLERQINIAREVRDLQNAQRALFNPNFVTKEVKMIGRYRVSVDASGNEGIFSEGAHKAFTADYYFFYTKNFPDVIRRGDCIYYANKHNEHDCSLDALPEN